jgi:hypothetical protein
VPVRRELHAVRQSSCNGSDEAARRRQRAVAEHELMISLSRRVGDAVHRNVREPVPPTMYIPLAQFDTRPQQPMPAQVTLAERRRIGTAGAAGPWRVRRDPQRQPRVSMQFRTLAIYSTRR